MFRIVLVPESKFEAKRFHYIILLDRSYSMEGAKLEMAKRGAELLMDNLPEDSYLSLISFNEKVSVIKEHVSSLSMEELDEAHEALSTIKPGSGTSLYKALQEAFKISKRYRDPTYLILLTDGVPTDMGCVSRVSNKFRLEECLEVYEKLEVPEVVETISFGIGDDYSPEILSKISERGNGFFYHISDPSEIPEKMPKMVKSKVAAKNVVVDLVSESPVKLLNYEQLPVKINAVEGVVKIFGEATIPPNFSGKFMALKVKYQDEGGEQRKEIDFNLKVAKDQSEFLQGVDRDVIMEYQYMQTLKGYSEALESQNLVEATKRLDKLREIAEQTRRQDLMESTNEMTKKMNTGDVKGITSEITRKMRSQE
ncbi:VWA domain-containing protein [Metallosphaera tengchongensis]|uniref:VWA domain-containing protein n=2 Tax=Metallosphaera tengchongensis TaxID=1532350 RepID=A0A6N0NXE6_9CREN|nr:VWA domain-containing protein [Metallosphaera tengchongensis]